MYIVLHWEREARQVSMSARPPALDSESLWNETQIIDA